MGMSSILEAGLLGCEARSIGHGVGGLGVRQAWTHVSAPHCPLLTEITLGLISHLASVGPSLIG